MGCKFERKVHQNYENENSKQLVESLESGQQIDLYLVSALVSTIAQDENISSDFGHFLRFYDRAK